jgi:uncharacterized protein involved in type VI secretion and phage assembly
LSQSSGRRIHQDRSSLDVIQATIAAHGGRVPPAKSRVTGPKAIREYCAQYDETDHELIQRLLADEAYLAFFDPTDAGTWTITDDPRVGCPVLPMPVAFRPPTDLVSTAPHVSG